jgi:carbon monoxide dehydrogenase subunit G
MASVRREIVTSAAPEAVWDAIRDIGALHTRLVPGFVVDTRVEPDGRARVVTFGNGMVVREPIVTLDEQARRLVWGAQGGPLTHYNSSVQVFPEGTGSRVVWVADFLPDEAAASVGPMIEQGMAVMKKTLDRPSA